MTHYKGSTSPIVEGSTRFIADEESRLGFDRQVPPPQFVKIVVLEVINDPMIIDEQKAEYYASRYGVSNIHLAYALPRNSIIGRRLLDDSSQEVPISMFFFPFMPSHIALPAKPGEHVWAMFDDPSRKATDIGWWMWRVVEYRHVDDVNHSHSPRANDPRFNTNKDAQQKFTGETQIEYDFRNGVGVRNGDEVVTADNSDVIAGGDNAYEEALTQTDASRLMQYESVPRYKKRPHEVVFEGSNNALIILGTDRSGPAYVIDTQSEAALSSGGSATQQPQDDAVGGAGMIDMVVGRGQTPQTAGTRVTNTLGNDEIAKDRESETRSEGDPDFHTDRARMLSVQRMSVDEKFNLDQFNIREFGVRDAKTEDGEPRDSASVVKADKVRFIARSDIEFVVARYTRDDAGRMIEEPDTRKWAAAILKSDGSIVFRPAIDSVVKLGGDDADKAVLCTDVGVSHNIGADGELLISAQPIISTAGGGVGIPSTVGQGTWASKVLIK